MAKSTDKKKDDKTVTDNSVQEPLKEEKVDDMEAEKPVSEPEKAVENADNDSEADGTEQPETEEDAGGEETGRQVLVAKAYILYNSRQYKPGEYLPANNPDMVAAWLGAGTAVWNCEQISPVKASPVAAVPGLAGAVSGAVPMSGLVGRVPEDISRNGETAAS